MNTNISMIRVDIGNGDEIIAPYQVLVDLIIAYDSLSNEYRQERAYVIADKYKEISDNIARALDGGKSK